MVGKLDELKTAHEALLREYINAVNEASRLPFYIPFQPKQSARFAVPLEGKMWRTGLLSKLLKDISPQPVQTGGLRYLVRLFIESHVKDKLRELSNAYLYLMQIIEDTEEGAGEVRAWLKEKSEACTKVADTLLSLRSVQGITATFWPLAVGLITASLKVNNIYEAVTKIKVTELLILGFALVFPVAYLFLFVAAAFTYKREWFMAGLDAFEQPLDGLPQDAPKRNVYQMEDRLFALVGRGKKREFPLDILARGLSLFVFIFPSLLLLPTDAPNWIKLSPLISVPFLITDIILCVIVVQRRVWR
ncbi:MAG: hypothetical protein ICV60_21250 [Pyrinomonadaceae bacterium]|nr:hypothetical protein [Pyrinomonadaceae bacterium]